MSEAYETSDKQNSNNDITKIDVYDYIDVNMCLEESKEAKIRKVDKESFIYNKQVDRQVTDSPDRRNKSDKFNPKLNKINTKFFSVFIEELIFETPNHLEYLLSEVYHFIEVIGEGSFGVVIRAIANTKNQIGYHFPAREVALKIIPIKDYNITNSIKHEVRILMSLNHPRLLKVYSLLENQKYMVIVMEHIKGRTLRDEIVHNYMNRKDCLFTEEEASTIMKGILEGISVLHNNNIIHRDIKPENMMFRVQDDLSSIKLIDLGLFTRVEDSLDFCHDICGTLYYMAPEISSQNPVYNELVDIWAAGIVLFILLSGGMHPLIKPYEWTNDKDFIKKLNNSKNGWKIPSTFSK